MLVQDSVRQVRDRKAQSIAAHVDQINNWTYEQLSRGVVQLDDSNAPMNPGRQMGRPMLPTELDKLLKQLNPNVTCEPHPTNPTKRIVWWVKPDGSRECVAPYEANLMPEFSILLARWQWIPDPDFMPDASGKTKEIPRVDGKVKPVSLQQAHELLQSKGFKGALSELKKRADDVDPDVHPGQKRVLKLWGEAIRGWRVVLVKLVQAGLCTPADIERVLGLAGIPNPDNASWSVATGARKHEQLRF